MSSCLLNTFKTQILILCNSLYPSYYSYKRHARSSLSSLRRQSTYSPTAVWQSRTNLHFYTFTLLLFVNGVEISQINLSHCYQLGLLLTLPTITDLAFKLQFYPIRDSIPILSWLTALSTSEAPPFPPSLPTSTFSSKSPTWVPK